MLSATLESGIENRHRIDSINRERFKVFYDAKQLGSHGGFDPRTFSFDAPCIAFAGWSFGKRIGLEICRDKS